ncbi:MULTISPECIES: hypothetical protein [Methanobacterium]|jgi:hypothetical protein|uniref:Uncharacterized protein n=2 Tax=Methanobacterium TaxID=2160 RepID=A0A9E5A405_9EURY|nr:MULTISPECIES: hypothetical protein [Methanobacterium]MCZ3366566.1 hypothetical protein [Methanobacterium veterum]MCZ3374290.1 hypothetical protein [Methanobacterium veterum]
MEYEMRIPPGTPSKLVEEVMEKYDKLEFKQTEHGPVIVGEKQDLEGAQDIIIRGLNQRIKELEDK